VTKSVVHSAVCDGTATFVVAVESSLTRGYANLQLIGNASEVCRDGKERARSALEHCGIVLPPRRIVISISPADVKKDGNHLDLPIAISLALLATGMSPALDPCDWVFAAELSLDGELRPVRGLVSFAIEALAQNKKGLVIAAGNRREMATLARFDDTRFQHLACQSFHSLAEVLAWLAKGEAPAEAPLDSVIPGPCDHTEPASFDDMALDTSQETIALVVATGLHSLMLRGTPGTGKSMFAQRLASILPDMGQGDHLDALKITSSYSSLIPRPLLRGRPPFRNPHHQTSAAALLGSTDGPGEISLAHGGILFLDEFPEFRRDLIEALREPLENGEVRLARARGRIHWPARFILVAAANNCPCGWFASSQKRCICTTQKLLAYRLKFSGPVLDRIDLHCNTQGMAGAPHESLFKRSAESQRSQRLRELVAAARAFGKERNQSLGVVSNRDLPAQRLTEASGLSESGFSALIRPYVAESPSPRAIVRALRVARTLADLGASAAIRERDLALAWGWQAEPAARARGEGGSGRSY